LAPQIPWHHITTEPITFDLDRVELVCEEIPLGSNEDQSGPYAFPRHHVASLPPARKHLPSPTHPPTHRNRKKERPTTSYAWAQRMIDGIKMNVGEVDMTMKFNGYRCVPVGCI
jgi:hypothetical protein